MKPSIFILFLFFSTSIFAQQSEIKGIISIQNSEYETGKRQYVQYAQVEDDFQKSQLQTTDANGYFKLIFVGVPEKISVQLIAKKEGLQVVNIDALGAVSGQREWVRLSMAQPDKIAEYRRQIYNVGKTEAEKNLSAQLKKKGEQIETLQKNAEKNRTAIEKVQREYAELQAFASKIEEQAQDLARRYAPINLDDAAPLYREAFRAFQQGELGKALQILWGADLVGQASKVLTEEKAISVAQRALNQRDSIKNQRKTDLMQVLGLKADLHKAQFQWDSVSFCLELRVSLDSNNVGNLKSLGDFLYEQNQVNEAIYYYEKALTLAKTPGLIATFLNNLSILNQVNQKMPQAEVTYSQALKIRRQLAEKNPDAFLPDVAITLNNLGLFYSDNRKMSQAEAAYSEALKIYRQLSEKNPDSFLPNVTAILNNLGNYYLANQKMPQAEAAYSEALRTIRQLAEKNPGAFLPNVAMTFNNLGLFYNDNQQMPQAEAAYSEALKIYTQLAEKNPNAFLPNVAATLNNLGIYYHANKKMPQAEDANFEALKIRRQLAEKNPDAFLPAVAMTLNNLSVIYRDNQKMPQAEAANYEALKIYRQLVEKNPDSFLPFVAATLSTLGNYYYVNQKMPQSEAAYVEALKIRKQLAEKNPAAFLPDVAMTLNNLGVVYRDLKHYEQSLNYYRDAKVIQEEAILSGGIHQFKEWVRVIQNILKVRDSSQVKKEFANVAKAGRLVAEGCDTLKGVNKQLLPMAVQEYGSLSWWALFAKDYALAEKAALRCLELDKSQDWVLTNLGHSQLLRGKYAAAKATYEKLKGKKDGKGKDYKLVLLDDLKAFEAEGISHKDFSRARTTIEKWY